MNLSNVILAEGDSGIAVFWCCNCKQSFRARMDSVTMADKQPVCLKCIEHVNPIRVARGMAPIPFNRAAYEPFTN